MNDKDFMNQRVKDMSVNELLDAVKLKNKKPRVKQKLSIAQEIVKYPERFLTLASPEKWVSIDYSDVSKVMIVNASWNYSGLMNKVYHIKFLIAQDCFHEIVRRKKP